LVSTVLANESGLDHMTIYSALIAEGVNDITVCDFLTIRANELNFSVLYYRLLICCQFLLGFFAHVNSLLII